MAKQLQKCGPFAGRQTISKKGLREWAERVRRIKQERWPDIDRVIMSNEMLSGANRLSDRPMLKVLSLLRQRFWTKAKSRSCLFCAIRPHDWLPVMRRARVLASSRGRLILSEALSGASTAADTSVCSTIRAG